MICECLVASDGMDLKYEEGICTLLLGQVGVSCFYEYSRCIFTIRVYKNMVKYFVFAGS